MITNRPDGNTYYNYTDLNRVEAAAADMAALLSAEGYNVTITVKTNWTMMSPFSTLSQVKAHFPTHSNMGRYLNNLKLIRQQFPALSGYELPETMRGLTYIGANNIEKMLVAIPGLVDTMKGAYRRCNTFRCGT